MNKSALDNLQILAKSKTPKADWDEDKNKPAMVNKRFNRKQSRQTNPAKLHPSDAITNTNAKIKEVKDNAPMDGSWSGFRKQANKTAHTVARNTKPMPLPKSMAKAWPPKWRREETLKANEEQGDGAPRTIQAKFPGRCKICNKRFNAGESIDYYPKARSSACAGGCPIRTPKPGTPQEGSEG